MQLKIVAAVECFKKNSCLMQESILLHCGKMLATDSGLLPIELVTNLEATLYFQTTKGKILLSNNKFIKKPKSMNT